MRAPLYCPLTSAASRKVTSWFMYVVKLVQRIQARRMDIEFRFQTYKIITEGTFLSKVNNRETIAATMVNNNTYCPKNKWRASLSSKISLIFMFLILQFNVRCILITRRHLYLQYFHILEKKRTSVILLINANISHLIIQSFSCCKKWSSCRNLKMHKIMAIMHVHKKDIPDTSKPICPRHVLKAHSKHI